MFRMTFKQSFSNPFDNILSYTKPVFCTVVSDFPCSSPSAEQTGGAGRDRPSADGCPGICTCLQSHPSGLSLTWSFMWPAPICLFPLWLQWCDRLHDPGTCSPVPECHMLCASTESLFFSVPNIPYIAADSSMLITHTQHSLSQMPSTQWSSSWYSPMH